MAGSKRVDGLGYDTAFVAVCAVSVGGLYLDGWAHNNNKVPLDDFWSPPHLVMYAGFGLVVLLLAVALVRNVRSGETTRALSARPQGGRIARLVSWIDVVSPQGYLITALGAAVYLLAGMVDKIWHDRLGIEATVEALFSPPHLGLLLGALLFRTGPLRAAWRRREAPRSSMGLLPMLLASAYALGSLQFFTQYVHPFGITAGASGFEPFATTPVTARGAELMGVGLFQQGEATHYVVTIAVVSVVVQTALLVGLALFLVDRWGPSLPAFSFTLIVGLNTAGMVFMRSEYLAIGVVTAIGIGLLGGLAFDLLRWRIRPWESARRFRWFAFLAPSIFYAIYVGGLWLEAGMWVKGTVWSGMPLLAGGVGWMMSFLVLQPPWTLLATSQPAPGEARGG